jgi:hypothetical protein
MTEPDFKVVLGDLLDGILSAIAEALGAAVAAIGELVIMVCEALFGSDQIIVVIPAGLCISLAAAFGVGYATADTGQWISTATIWIAGGLIAFFVIAILLASLRRRRP